MRSWIDDHGRAFGWAKTEAFSEWWHVNFIGGTFPPPFKPLHGAPHRSHGKRVVFYTKRLAYIHHPHGNAYLKRWFWRYKDPVVEGVKHFQKAQGLTVDGVIGEHTAHRISAVFHKQYANRNKRARLVRKEGRKYALTFERGGRKRLLRDVIKLRP